MSETPRARDYAVKTVERALSLLDLFTFRTPERTFTELCRETGLSKATVKRLVHTLETHRYLERDERTGRYRLGLKLFQLGNVVAAHLEVRSRALPYLQKLRDRTGETVVLISFSEGQQVYLEKLEGLGTVRITAQVGTIRTPFHGLGKVLLAFLEPGAVEKLLPPGDLPRFTMNTICDRQEFLEHLRSIRKNGYGIDDEEYIEGVTAVGAPVFDSTGKILAAVGVLGPSMRMCGERLAEVVELTKRAAETISQQLGSAI
ncbi:MAG: IclR family transcriptional regulator [Betaproteobacteria bacterium]